MNVEETIVVADVGGTNARFAMVQPGSTEIYNAETLAVKDFVCLGTAFRDYTSRRGLASAEQACVALAGPIKGDQVQLTNGDWKFSVSQTRSDLGLDKLVVINDFKAQALALAHMDNDHLFSLGGDAPVDARPKVILGPGTGLGVAAVVPTESGFAVVESEGGHVGISPLTDSDIAVYQKLLKQYGRVSAERILCGSGLRNLYRTLCELEDQVIQPFTEAEIVECATQKKDELCLKALNFFMAYLGAVAGDLALTFGANGGVYIAGGIVPRLKDHIAKTEFRHQFEAKGRLAYMVKDIPTYLVTSEHTGLIGAAAHLNTSAA